MKTEIRASETRARLRRVNRGSREIGKDRGQSPPEAGKPPRSEPQQHRA